MNTNILRYVMAVHDEKSMTKAAKKLFVAQPSLSQSIRALEAELGVQLFDRRKTPIETTYAGEIFVNWAATVLVSERRMRSRIADIVSNRQRKLIIGVSSQRNMQTLSTILQRFYAVTTDCSIVIKECELNELEQLLEQDVIDIMVDEVCPDSSNFISIPIVRERVLLAAPDSYVFNIVEEGEYPSISISELADKPVVFLSLSKRFSDTLYDIYKRINATPYIVFECQNLLVAHSMVSINVGITLMPEYSINNSHLQNVKYYTLHECPITRTIGVTYRKDRAISKDAAVLISVIKEMCGGLTGSDNIFE